MNFDGIEFECKQHGIDYRIACEDCNEKWLKFAEVMVEISEEAESAEITNKENI